MRRGIKKWVLKKIVIKKEWDGKKYGFWRYEFL